MPDLLPDLMALKGIFPENIPSLVDCYYYPLYEETQGPAITFSTAVANVGEGRLELIIGDEKIVNGQRVAPATQRIYNTDNSFRDRDTGRFVFHTDPDGHNHWHFQGFELFEILDEDGRRSLAKGNKEGFCMVDSFKYKSTAVSPSRPQYFEEGCEDKSKKKMGGVSIGWADVYPIFDHDQCIDVSNLESGTYLLRLTANPNNSIETASRTTTFEQIKIKLNKKNEGPVPIL
jgi:hypothetical protein